MSKKTHCIEPQLSLKAFFLELLDRRQLFYMIPKRDFLLRYQQSLFGVAWSILRPLIQMAMLVFVFATLGHMSSSKSSYPLYIFCSILPWNYFSQGLTCAIPSIVSSKELLCRIRIPAILLPLSHLILHLIDWSLGLLLSLIWIFYEQGTLPLTLFLYPLPFLLTLLLTTGTSLLLSALNTLYRDVILLVPFFLQILLFLSPIGYNLDHIPERLAPYFLLNPLSGILTLIRYSCFQEVPPYFWPSILSTTLISTLLFVIGSLFCIRQDQKWAEIL